MVVGDALQRSGANPAASAGEAQMDEARPPAGRMPCCGGVASLGRGSTN